MKHTNAENAQSMSSRSNPSTGSSAVPGCDEQAIRERAYEIHRSHDDPSRSPALDWLEAEQQIKMATSRPSTKCRS
jgi:hypothetical protein